MALTRAALCVLPTPGIRQAVHLFQRGHGVHDAALRAGVARSDFEAELRDMIGSRTTLPWAVHRDAEEVAASAARRSVSAEVGGAVHAPNMAEDIECDQRQRQRGCA